MSYFKTPPIPLLEASSERELMARFLFGTKHIKGLTTALVQTAGVKSKWLKPDEPRNIPAKRLLRIVLHTMHFLGREECKQRAILAIDYVFDHILPCYVNDLADKQKLRPPCIRCLYRHRYGRGRDADLPFFQRELKSYILRRGILHQREPHDPPAKPP